MRVVVSNLAWDPEEDEAAAAVLSRHGVTGIEVAPTKRWPDPSGATTDEIEAYRRGWSDVGLPIVSMQSLLFGRPDLTLFDSEAAREAFTAYLEAIIELGRGLGAGPLVFGSPKNRLRGSLSLDDAQATSAPVFARLGRAAAALGSCFCIEPNPVDYGCDFITTAAAGAALVRVVGEPGFGLHLDSGGMTLAGDDLPQAISGSLDVLRHFHCSEPGLAPAGSTGRVDHEGAARALRDGGYEGLVSVEMLLPADADRMACLDESVGFAVSVYG